VGLKTHCKLALVVRDEPDGLRRYAHLGTGNYNPKTARVYEDLGLLTSDPDITSDLLELFNALSGFGQQDDYRSLLVAPSGLRDGLVERIEREIGHQRAGRPAGISFKVNSLVDEAVIDALYRASQAGVPVRLVIRGICTLRPGVPGLSENIEVRSVLGRFLEHSRVYWFAGGGEAEAWLGSADLMHRNLDRRVEVLVRVPRADHVESLGDLLATMADDATSSWHLGADGAWTRHATDRDVQSELIARARHRRSRAAAN
jgi:polyphosphate kinase